MTIRFVLSLLFALLVAVFALQNSISVTINFLFMSFTISQALVILISAVLGAVIVLFLGTIKQIKSNIKIRNLTKTISGLEEENKSLKESLNPEANRKVNLDVDAAESEDHKK